MNKIGILIVFFHAFILLLLSVSVREWIFSRVTGFLTFIWSLFEDNSNEYSRDIIHILQSRGYVEVEFSPFPLNAFQYVSISAFSFSNGPATYVGFKPELRRLSKFDKNTLIKIIDIHFPSDRYFDSIISDDFYRVSVRKDIQKRRKVFKIVHWESCSSSKDNFDDLYGIINKIIAESVVEELCTHSISILSFLHLFIFFLVLILIIMKLTLLKFLDPGVILMLNSQILFHQFMDMLRSLLSQSIGDSLYILLEDLSSAGSPDMIDMLSRIFFVFISPPPILV
jgi:hypothetical protein